MVRVRFQVRLLATFRVRFQVRLLATFRVRHSNEIHYLKASTQPLVFPFCSRHQLNPTVNKNEYFLGSALCSLALTHRHNALTQTVILMP